MIDDKLIGSNIRKYRQMKGLSQRQLADRLTQSTEQFVSVQTVSAWQLGKRSISAVMLMQVAHCLEIVAYLLVCEEKSNLSLTNIIPLLAQHEVDIINYLIREWNGDARILLQFDLLYALLPHRVRYEIAQEGIERYKAYIKGGGRTNHDVPLRLQSIITGWKNLLQEVEDAE